MDAIESEVRQMQSELAEVEELLSSPQALPKHKEEKLKVAPLGGKDLMLTRKMLSLSFSSAIFIQVSISGKKLT